MATSLGKGGTTFADSTVQVNGQIRLKNRIINGGMIVDQMAKGNAIPVGKDVSTGNTDFAAATTVYGQYTVDRWIFQSTGNPGSNAGVVRIKNQLQQDGVTTLPVLNFTSGVTRSYATTAGFAQRIESIYLEDLRNTDVTLSAFLSAVPGSPSVYPTTVYWAVYRPSIQSVPDPTDQWSYVNIPFNGGATPVVGTSIYNNTIQVASGSWSVGSTAWQNKYSATFTIGQVNTNGVDRPASKDGLMVYFYIQIPADASGYQFNLTNVQLEVGEGASTFEERSITEEIRLCQRYMYCDGFATPTGALRYNYPSGSFGPWGRTSYTHYPSLEAWSCPGSFVFPTTGYQVQAQYLKWTFPVPMRNAHNNYATGPLAFYYYYRPRADSEYIVYSFPNNRLSMYIGWLVGAGPYYQQGAITSTDSKAGGSLPVYNRITKTSITQRIKSVTGLVVSYNSANDSGFFWSSSQPVRTNCLSNSLISVTLDVVYPAQGSVGDPGYTSAAGELGEFYFGFKFISEL